MCCGAGGARMWMEESIGTEGQRRAAPEAISTGATRVATACPFCYIMLDDGVKAAGMDDAQVKVADISIHLLDAIENGERTLVAVESPLARITDPRSSSIGVPSAPDPAVPGQNVGEPEVPLPTSGE
jgi:hypothetical protein